MSWDIGDDAKSCIEMAFDISDRLNTQSLGIRFCKGWLNGVIKIGGKGLRLTSGFP